MVERADLIERLKARDDKWRENIAQWRKAAPSVWTDELVQKLSPTIEGEAADALAAAEAEIARVKLHLSAWEDSARINKDRAERAEAEIDRLTKALALAILATT